MSIISALYTAIIATLVWSCALPSADIPSQALLPTTAGGDWQAATALGRSYLLRAPASALSNRDSFQLEVVELGDETSGNEIRIESTDSHPAAFLPQNKPFTGHHVSFDGLRLITPGPQTVRILVGGTELASMPVQVAAGPAVKLTATPFQKSNAGEIQEIEVALFDAFDFPTSTHPGTITVASGDPNPSKILPPPFRMETSKTAVKVSFATAGIWNLRFSDSLDTNLSTEQSAIAIAPDPIASFDLESELVLAPLKGKKSRLRYAIGIQAKDVFGNPAYNYRGITDLSVLDKNQQPITFRQTNANFLGKKLPLNFAKLNNPSGFHRVEIIMQNVEVFTVQVTDRQSKISSSLEVGSFISRSEDRVDLVGSPKGDNMSTYSQMLGPNDKVDGRGGSDTLWQMADKRTNKRTEPTRAAQQLGANLQNIEGVKLIPNTKYPFAFSTTITPGVNKLEVFDAHLTHYLLEVDASKYDKPLRIEGGINDDILKGGLVSGNKLIGWYGADIIIGNQGDDHIYPDSPDYQDLNLPKPILWLDATNPSGKIISIADGTSSGWLNLATGEWGNSTQPPSYVTTAAGLGGRAAFYFDGASWLEFPEMSYTEFTMVAVVKQETGAAQQTLFTDFAGPYNQVSLELGIDIEGTAIDQRQNGFPLRLFNPASTAQILSYSYDLRDQLFSVQQSTTSLATDFGARAPNPTLYYPIDFFSPNTRSQPTLGANLTDGRIEPFKGMFAEFLLFKKALNATQRIALQAYLASKYQLRNQLQDAASYPIASGPDQLTGGPGADTFHFNVGSISTPDNPDQILDFNPSAGDKIDLSEHPVSLTFIEDRDFEHKGIPQLRYTRAALGTYIQIDWGGDGIADMQILLKNFNQDLRATDILWPKA